MNALVKARGLRKTYKNYQALDDISFDVQPGRIVGLIGPNGAGKTTLLKGLLGLLPIDGELSVLGRTPAKQRKQLLENVSFVADTAILPKWLTVAQAVEYVAGVHPKFNREKAVSFLSHTNIKTASKIASLSKGMVTQLHLALIMAIDSQLLVLDEPTLGLDIIYRKQFYTALLNDYFDEQKTIIIATHQVEEVEHILTDLMFVDQGKLILNCSIEDVQNQYSELHVDTETAKKVSAKGLKLLSETPRLGGVSLLFEGVPKEILQEIGDVRTPSISDLFVAKIQYSQSAAGAF